MDLLTTIVAFIVAMIVMKYAGRMIKLVVGLLVIVVGLVLALGISLFTIPF